MALRILRAEVMDALVLNNRDRLMADLNAAMARERTEQFQVLLLDTNTKS